MTKLVDNDGFRFLISCERYIIRMREHDGQVQVIVHDQFPSKHGPVETKPRGYVLGRNMLIHDVRPSTANAPLSEIQKGEPT